MSRDPVDHARTTRKHAGEAIKNGANAPGMLAVAAGVIALMGGLVGAATGHATIAVFGIVLAVVLGAVGLTWFAFTHRRVRDVERRWNDRHPGAATEPPTS